jgi:DNA-binding response OmpR family regulator
MRTILIIDDDVAFTAKLKEQLTEAGYRVLTSNFIVPGENLCVREHPDLVLLEVQTERGAGWDALPRLSALQPVIVLSSIGLEEHVMKAFAAVLPIMSPNPTVPANCWRESRRACSQRRR